MNQDRRSEFRSLSLKRSKLLGLIQSIPGEESNLAISLLRESSQGALTSVEAKLSALDIAEAAACPMTTISDWDYKSGSAGHLSTAMALCRDAAGLSQHDMGEKLKVTQPAISQFESQSTEVSLSRLKQWAAATGRTLQLNFRKTDDDSMETVYQNLFVDAMSIKSLYGDCSGIGLKVLLNAIQRATKADTINVYLSNLESNHLELIEGDGCEPGWVPRRSAPMQMLRYPPELVSDTSSHPILKKSQYIQEYGFRSAAVMPFRSSRGRGIAFLNFRALRNFGPYESSYLFGLSQMLGLYFSSPPVPHLGSIPQLDSCEDISCESDVVCVLAKYFSEIAKETPKLNESSLLESLRLAMREIGHPRLQVQLWSSASSTFRPVDMNPDTSSDIRASEIKRAASGNRCLYFEKSDFDPTRGYRVIFPIDSGTELSNLVVDISVDKENAYIHNRDVGKIQNVCHRAFAIFEAIRATSDTDDEKTGISNDIPVSDQHVNLMTEMIEGIKNSTSVRDRINTIVKMVKKEFEADLVDIWQIDWSSGDPVFSLDDGASSISSEFASANPNFDHSFVFPRHIGFTAQNVASDNPYSLWIDDASTDRRVNMEVCKTFGFKTMLGMPVYAPGYVGPEAFIWIRFCRSIPAGKQSQIEQTMKVVSAFIHAVLTPVSADCPVEN